MQPEAGMLKLILHLVLLGAVVSSVDVGTKLKYSYDTKVLINEDCSYHKDKDLVGHGLKASVYVTPVWKNKEGELIKIQVSNVGTVITKKSAFETKKSSLESAKSSESYVLLNEGKAERFWDDPNENLVLRNLKKAIASSLQVLRKDSETEEVGVSGRCQVYYKTKEKNILKYFRNCKHPQHDWITPQREGVRSAAVTHSSGIEYEFKDGGSEINRISGSEFMHTYSNIWKASSVCVSSMFDMIQEGSSADKEVYKNGDLNSVITEIKKSRKVDLVEGDLFATTTEVNQESADVQQTVKGFQEGLKMNKLAKLKSSSAFFKLLPIFRTASKEDILKVLESKKFNDILPQILDLVAASSTKSCVEAALTFFSKVKQYDENFERYLISLSVAPKVESYVLKELKFYIEQREQDQKIEASLITTLGALLRTYSRSTKADVEVVSEIREFLEKRLTECNDDACSLRYLRGLRNSAQTDSAPLLINYALKGKKPALEALLAVEEIPELNLSTESQLKLIQIFNQVGQKQDRSTRTIAAEILLKISSDDDVLKGVLRSLSDQTDPEFSTFLSSKILYLMTKDEVIRSRVLKLLTDNEIGHYYSLAQNGKSSIFERQLISTENLNVTYGIEMELLQGGLLKRSSFDVNFETKQGLSNLLTVGMFAEGLGSLAGGDSSENDAGPTAGMELTVLGSSLRPYVFFTSTSEVMGHAWSGTASEPTPALQGIFLLTDDSNTVILNNGMAVRTDLRGVMSTDLSASIQISLWSRNSQALVKNAAALLVKASAVVDLDEVSSKGEFQFYGQSAIDFKTDSEFYEMPFKMCLKMELPKVLFRYDFQRVIEESGKVMLRKTKKRKRHISGRSYALHQSNNEQCRLMAGSE